MNRAVISEPRLIARRDAYHVAVEALRCGINILPIAGDGSKRPPIKWDRYQRERVTPLDLERWFLFSKNYPGLAFVTGAVSQNLELLDFDDRESYQLWCEQMHTRGLAALAERVASGYLEATPNGVHLLYRCRQVEGNQKLASRQTGPNERKTLIETRGEGGLVVVAPSCGGVHPSGRPYQLLQGGATSIQLVTLPERQKLLESARSLDELPPPEVWHPRPFSVTHQQDRNGEMGERPGDIFNRRASWDDVLAPHGWKLLGTNEEGASYWQRPGKEGTGTSATTNYGNSDLLYVFTTSTVFEANRGYSKFTAYTLLTYGQLSEVTFATAASDLALQGYTSTTSLRKESNPCTINQQTHTRSRSWS